MRGTSKHRPNKAGQPPRQFNSPQQAVAVLDPLHHPTTVAKSPLERGGDRDASRRYLTVPRGLTWQLLIHLLLLTCNPYPISRLATISAHRVHDAL